MKTSIQTKWLGMLALASVIFAGGILFAGCQQPPQVDKQPAEEASQPPPAVTVTPVKTAENVATPAQVATPTQVATPVTPPVAAPLSENEIGKQIIEVQEKLEEVEKSEGRSSAAAIEIRKQRDELLTKVKPVSFTEKLDVLAVNIRVTGSDKAKLSFLVRANEQLSSDYKFTVGATVKKDFKELLSPDADIEKLRENIAFWPSVRSTNWTPGRPILLSTETNLKAIPYQISVTISANKPPHQLGTPQVIGWFGDIEE